MPASFWDNDARNPNPTPICPLSPALSWTQRGCRLGFSKAGVLAACDSAGELSARSPDFGGAWVRHSSPDPRFEGPAHTRIFAQSSPLPLHAVPMSESPGLCRAI